MFSYTANGELKIQKNNLIEGFNIIPFPPPPMPENNSNLINTNVASQPASQSVSITESTAASQPASQSVSITESTNALENSIVDKSIIKNDFESLSLTCDFPIEMATQIYDSDFDDNGKLRLNKYKNTLRDIEELVDNKIKMDHFMAATKINNPKKQLKCILNKYKKYIPKSNDLYVSTDYLILKIDDLDSNSTNESSDIVSRFCINNKCLSKDEIIKLYNHIN